MEELFRRLVEKGGCIVSSADCHQIEIADARVRGDWWVDENGMGFVLRLPEWLARHSMDARGANSDTCEIRARSGARGV